MQISIAQLGPSLPSRGLRHGRCSLPVPAPHPPPLRCRTCFVVFSQRRPSSGCGSLEEPQSREEGTDGMTLLKASERSPSFDVAAPPGWTSTVEARPVDVHESQQTTEAPALLSAPGGNKFTSQNARGGCIKVKKDVYNKPRISVFMSKPRSRPSAPTPAPPARVERSPRFRPLVVSTSALPGNYTRPPVPTTESAVARAPRTKDVRVVVRARPQAEQCIAEMNSAVVAMGAPRVPSPPLDETLAPPILQRASSVGALTITGNVEAFCRSPSLGSTGEVVPTYELSEHMQGGAGQRRNLICKVFGSPSSGTLHPGNP